MAKRQSFVITGANSYLGRTFAKILSRNENYRVFLTSRSKFNFNQLLKKKNVYYLPGIDLTLDSDAKQFAVEVNNFLPEKFHVINCLGFFPGYHTIEEIDTPTAKQVFDSNVLTLYSVANHLLPLMRKRRGGHFIGFSTHTSYQHYPKMVAFTAAKAAVESLIRGIGNEYLKEGIQANTMGLATLLTEIELKIKPKGDSKNWLSTEEVCAFVEDFISQRSKLANGNVIHVYKYSDSYFHESYFNRIKPK